MTAAEPLAAKMKVHVVGVTRFIPPPDVDWTTDTDGGQALAEFAGRACYASWAKPNPATATNAGYLAHIIDVGHNSVLEHGVVTVYITGVSRSLTHELVRHRHFSYSQLSQRYVPAKEVTVVVPPLFAGDREALRTIERHQTVTRNAYDDLVARAEELLAESRECPECRQRVTYVNDPAGWECGPCGKLFSTPQVSTAVRKQARQAARAVLPNATETKIVVTGNYRAWRHFIRMRATAAADVEIRQLAIACLGRLALVAPNVFADFRVTMLPDGTHIAVTDAPPDE